MHCPVNQYTADPYALSPWTLESSPQHNHRSLFRSITILSFAFVFLQAAAEYIPEKVKKAEKKLEENPYDLDAWSILIREAQV